MAVMCYPLPAIFEWPSDFNVLNQYEQDNDVTLFDVSVAVTDDVRHSFPGRNGNNGDFYSEFVINVQRSSTEMLAIFRAFSSNIISNTENKVAVFQTGNEQSDCIPANSDSCMHVLQLFCLFVVAATWDVTMNSSCADAVDLSMDCTLTCTATDHDVNFTLHWQFKTKFSDMFLVLTAEIEANSTELSLMNATTSDAGTYRCSASSATGVTLIDLDLEVNCKFMHELLSYKSSFIVSHQHIAVKSHE